MTERASTEQVRPSECPTCEAVREGFERGGITRLSINGVRIFPPETIHDTHPGSVVLRPDDLLGGETDA